MDAGGELQLPALQKPPVWWRPNLSPGQRARRFCGAIYDLFFKNGKVKRFYIFPYSREYLKN